MNADERGNLRQAMYEAALLAPDHPQRQELEETIAQTETWAESEWLELLRYDERLRLELQKTPVPPNLEDRLLDIPHDVPRKRRSFVWQRALAVAAAVMILVGGGLSFQAGRKYEQKSLVRAAALMALDDHLTETPVLFETADPRELEAHLAQAVSFPVSFPELDPSFTLVGGGKSYWGGYPVVYTLWKQADETFSLVLFRTDDLGLPNSITKSVICCPTLDELRREYKDILLWADEGSGYAFVGNHGSVDGAASAGTQL